MASSLKDALLKVGFSEPNQENKRPIKKKKKMTNTEAHQEERDFCEVCKSVQPDVERYKHRNPLLDGEWVCCNCADEHMLHDKFRVSTQSNYSRKNIFMRRYGPTLDPKANK
ncbi:MAG: hypothetical protein KAG61_09710 [Bacteriovoracaceae bacterium]|nr:hypothetical protein [Bacteriovoracaceae bacterium]